MARMSSLRSFISDSCQAHACFNSRVSTWVSPRLGWRAGGKGVAGAQSQCTCAVSYTHLRAHETSAHL
eukprot:13959727-Alexandrium_andersonii.AAC.1